MKLFHISHTDLDGYGCQLITNEFFNDTTFYNANYGLEVKLSIKKVLEEIKKYKDKEIFFIISDLNLNLQESEELDKDINHLLSLGFDIKLQLLDHHISGQKSSDKFQWYYLNDRRSATKIVYDYILKRFDADISYLAPLVNAINAVDIWLEDENKNFEFGKVLMSMITKVKEINSILFADLNREFKFDLLKKSMKFLDEENGHIKLDNEVHFMKKDFLKLDENDDTLDNLSAIYLVKCLDDIKNRLTVHYKEHKGLLTYCLGSISIPANAFLNANSDYDFFIDINKKGNASLRANGNLDVALLASKLANGGGHINASGCKFEDFEETIDYLEVKKYIQDKLNSL